MPRFFIDVEARFAQFQDALDKITKNTASSAKQMERAFGGVRNTIAGLIGGVSIGAIGREMLTAAKEGEQASARLTAVLRATGHAAGLTKDQLDEMAESMQAALGFDDESLRNAQSALLKFGNIQGDVFREGLRLSADLAAFMGTDIPEAAQIVGKSLQSPTEGLTQMERQFGKLTKEQEDNIQSLVRQGKAIEAQNAVLDLWRQKIGGTADLMNTGLTKATRDVANAWDDMLEALGRTEKVGGTVRDILGGLRDVLRDIEGLSKGADVGLQFNRQIDAANNQIGALEKQLERAKQPGGKGLVAFSGEGSTVQVLETRIEQLKAERRALIETRNAALSKTVDPFSFAGIRSPVALGGDTSDATGRKAALAAEQREAEFRAQKAVELEEMAAQDTREAWEAYFKDRQEQEAELQKARSENMRQWFETIDQEQERAIEAGAALIESTDQLDNAFARMGFTATSALEDLILKGGEAGDVIRALGQDLLRMVLRQAVLDPLATGITAGVKGLFGGGKADGGSVSAGRAYVVGERGHELFIPDRSGTIVPNHQLGGVTLVQHLHFNGGSPAVVREAAFQAAPIAAKMAQAAVMEANKRGRS